MPVGFEPESLTQWKDGSSRQLLQALQTPKVQEQLATLGFDPMPMQPRDFDAYVRQEILFNARLVKASGRDCLPAPSAELAAAPTARPRPRLMPRDRLLLRDQILTPPKPSSGGDVVGFFA